MIAGHASAIGADGIATLAGLVIPILYPLGRRIFLSVRPETRPEQETRVWTKITDRLGEASSWAGLAAALWGAVALAPEFLAGGLDLDVAGLAGDLRHRRPGRDPGRHRQAGVPRMRPKRPRKVILPHERAGRRRRWPAAGSCLIDYLPVTVLVVVLAGIVVWALSGCAASAGGGLHHPRRDARRLRHRRQGLRRRHRADPRGRDDRRRPSARIDDGYAGVVATCRRVLRTARPARHLGDAAWVAACRGPAGDAGRDESQRNDRHASTAQAPGRTGRRTCRRSLGVPAHAVPRDDDEQAPARRRHRDALMEQAASAWPKRSRDELDAADAEPAGLRHRSRQPRQRRSRPRHRRTRTRSSRRA